MRNCVGGYAGRPSKTGELERQSNSKIFKSWDE